MRNDRNCDRAMVAHTDRIWAAAAYKLKSAGGAIAGFDGPGSSSLTIGIESAGTSASSVA